MYSIILLENRLYSATHKDTASAIWYSNMLCLFIYFITPLVMLHTCSDIFRPSNVYRTLPKVKWSKQISDKKKCVSPSHVRTLLIQIFNSNYLSHILYPITPYFHSYTRCSKNIRQHNELLLKSKTWKKVIRYLNALIFHVYK